MKLNDSDIFVIKTIATYQYFDKCEKEGVITKEMFNDSYEKFSEVQKAIISYFIAEETELIQNFTEILKKHLMLSPTDAESVQSDFECLEFRYSE